MSFTLNAMEVNPTCPHSLQAMSVDNSAMATRKSQSFVFATDHVATLFEETLDTNGAVSSDYLRRHCMASRNALLLLLQFLTLFAFELVIASWGSVTFYNKMWHDDAGGKYTYYLIQAQQCINLSCYNDRATSAKWSDIVKWGAFDGDSRIAFYTDANSTGMVRHWEIEDPNGYPENFFLDDMDNKISSFMIWQFSKDVWGSSLPCLWDFKCCLG
ncbi:hypothetical protein JM18_007777 [Phytophthora kernoviae]|uniref:Uncharacterized protein n=2 Tax=Phytophthora kernoviae TaxID=325452 RepID=A0A921SCI0_9STRA|nr:hypothetical protein G195_009363 [Phytophthora kernoviae 00238/432]KAG2518191.1 hypothetical protein JM18_007777 [Phytophthora kernoviae]